MLKMFCDCIAFDIREVPLPQDETLIPMVLRVAFRSSLELQLAGIEDASERHRVLDQLGKKLMHHFQQDAETSQSTITTIGQRALLAAQLQAALDELHAELGMR